MFGTDKKSFKYVGGDRVNVRSGYRTAPVPVTSQKARIRVQAGDKCVAPVKSRPKKRKHLTAKEQTGLSMAAVEWSEKSYPVADLVQYHGNRFPIIAKVTSGYKGDLDADYTNGMVSTAFISFMLYIRCFIKLHIISCYIMLIILGLYMYRHMYNLYTHTYACVCVYVSMDVCMHVHMCVSLFYMHTSVCIRICYVYISRSLFFLLLLLCNY